jgi:hypothetical protein
MADVLFLLKPGFADAKAGPVPYYCPPCATISGLLSYHPELREKVEVRSIAFPRPRAEVVELLGGPDHPGCPVLVLDDASAVPAGVTVHRHDRQAVPRRPDRHRQLPGRHSRRQCPAPVRRR